MDEQNNEQTQTTEEKKNNSLPLVVVGIIVLVAVVGFLATWGATKPSTNETTEPTQESNSTPAVTNETPPAEGAASDALMSDVVTITMDAANFSYSQKEIRVKKGQKVKIVMTSKDMMHDFNIDELGVKLPVTKAGETNTVEFTADKAGTFEYYCSVGLHRQNGQVGTLIVE